jgi:hypothetical protein
VPTFLIELYDARSSGPPLADHGELFPPGAVRHLQTILLPEDETCFILVEAGSAEDVREAAGRVGLGVDRITAARIDQRAALTG